MERSEQVIARLDRLLANVSDERDTLKAEVERLEKSNADYVYTNQEIIRQGQVAEARERELRVALEEIHEKCKNLIAGRYWLPIRSYTRTITMDSREGVG